MLHHSGAGTLQIIGLAISHGRWSVASEALGGCIYSSSQEASLVLSNSTVSGCTAGSAINTSGAAGGGIYAAGNLTLIDSALTGNLAEASTGTFRAAFGGGANVGHGNVQLFGSTISDNTASRPYFGEGVSLGGGIAALDSAKATVVGSTFSGNRAVGSSAQSGGLEAADAEIDHSLFADNEVVGYNSYASAGKFGVLSLKDSTISNNTAATSSSYGNGYADYALRVSYGLTITGSTISGNRAKTCAGIGVFSNYGRTPMVIADSTISGNASSGRGGAVCMNDSAVLLLIVGSTITFNTAGAGHGAGFSFVNYYESASADFESTIIANNSVDDGSRMTPADVDGPGNRITGANNLIIASTIPVPPDTLSEDPLLGPLQDNGGLTLTHALLAGSPAIDAGNNEALLEFDQRGAEFNRVFGPAADIGAFEVQPLPYFIFRDGFDP